MLKTPASVNDVGVGRHQTVILVNVVQGIPTRITV